MQKKKSQAKLNLPAVGIKPTETSKNYTSKSPMGKCREIEERNIYFEMPSIHQNDLSLKAFIEGEEKPLHKIQMRILRFFESVKEIKMQQEWDLYIKKSQILNNRNIEFSQLEEFLVKIVFRVASKLSQTLQATSISVNMNKSMKTSFNFDYDSKDFSETYNKTTYLQDKILDQQSLINSNKLNKSEGPKQNNQQNTVLHQNVLLQKKNEIYEKRIQQMTIALKKFEQKQNDNGGQKDVTSEMMQAIMAKNKYKYESQVKSMHIQSLTRELKTCKELSNILKIKNEELDSNASKLLAQNLKYKEYLKYKQLWLMATQQAGTWRSMFHVQRQEKEKCVAKIKLLKDKNKQLLNYFNVSNAVNPDQEEDKQDLDKIIREFKQWLMVISVPKVANNNYDQQNPQPQRLNNSEELNIKLLRPNFYVFFEAFQHTLLVEKNIINIRPIQYSFFLKIRVIFDTMFRQFLIAKSYKDYPSFPEYVIGFLQKYQINLQTGKVEYRRKPIQNEQKITFLVNLFNKNFCNTWQCEIFKNFLYENYYLDQIFFFLECRNQFNSGIPSSNTLGSVDPISYVKLSKALKIVTKQLAPYENYIIQKVKNILKSKKKIKYGQAFIDKHFVLKLLLEVYSLQRAKSQRIFQSSFNLKMKKSYITFGDFHHFMTRNFNYITSIQIAQLYREAYTLSSGHVTHKAIHYLCGSKGLFIPLLQQKRINRSGLQQSLSGDMLLLDVQNVITKLIGHLQDFGEESLMSFQRSLNGFMRQLQYYKGNKALFYMRLYQQKCNVLRVNTLLQLASSYELSPSQIVQQAQVQTRMIELHSLLHQTDTRVPLLNRQKERRSKAWVMITRNFKIRIQQSMLQFDKVSQDEINKLKQQIKQTNNHKQQELEEELKKDKLSQTKILP